jgi:hypothetical protein
MAITINGTGSIGGLSAGGLPSATVTQATLATPIYSQGVPAFSATGTTVSTTTATYTKLPFNSKVFDTNNNYDSTTNYRFTPTVAGYYQINITCQFYPAASNAGNCNIYKNGSLVTASSCLLNISVYPQVTTSALVYCNGSTDYIEGYAYQGSGGNLTVQATLFSGSMVRGA